jgi:hypothetical protein
MNCTPFTGGPATNDWRRPKTLLFSSDGMYFQASRAMMAPSGNGSFRARQALIARSFARARQKNLGPSGLFANSLRPQTRACALLRPGL